MQERKINFAVCVHMMRWFDSHAAGGFNKYQRRNMWMILLQPHTHWNVVCYTYNLKKTIYVVVHFYLWFELYFPLFNFGVC